MKRFYIIRHAKAAPADAKLRDFDRPLNPEGEENALRMGVLLAKKHIFPDLILTSPALRAKSTAKRIAKELGSIAKVNIEHAIYEASWADLLQVVKSIHNTASTVMLVGHNPGLSYLGHHLVGFNENLPTCGILEIDLDIDYWSDIEIADAKLLSFEYPKKNTVSPATP